LAIIRIRLGNVFLGLLKKDLCSVSCDQLYDNEHQIAEFAAFAFYVRKECKCYYSQSSSITVKEMKELWLLNGKAQVKPREFLERKLHNFEQRTTMREE
jgi:hypothetical protein